MFEQAFKNIDDSLHKDAGCSSELDYTEQTSWLLFLKYLDALEQDKATEARLEGRDYQFILAEDYCWDSWAVPKTSDGRVDHNKAMNSFSIRSMVLSFREARTTGAPVDLAGVIAACKT